MSPRESSDLNLAHLETVPLAGLRLPAVDPMSPSIDERSLTVVDWSGGTDIGLVRPVNEDSWGQLDGRAFVVADGMGGRAGGLLASRTAVGAMLHAFGTGIAGAAWVETVADVNRLVGEVASAHGHDRAGTTMVAASVEIDQATVINVGDSRIYRLRSANLDRLTRDHNLREDLLDAGRAVTTVDRRTPLDALTSYLGGPSVDVELASTTLRFGDRYLLCTDGIHGQLNDDAVARLLSAPTCDEAVQGLLRAASAAGGRDNATVVVVDIGRLVS